MKQIPNKTITLQCEDCGHVQEVRSAAAYEYEDGTQHFWFGSAYDFCDICDGLPRQINHEKI